MRFINNALKTIYSASWDYILVPDTISAHLLRHHLRKTCKQGLILPQIVTFHRPLNYSASCLLSKRPTSFGQSLAWALIFLRSQNAMQPNMDHEIEIASRLLNPKAPEERSDKMHQLFQSWYEWWDRILQKHQWTTQEKSIQQAQEIAICHWYTKAVLCLGDADNPSDMAWITQLMHTANQSEFSKLWIKPDSIPEHCMHQQISCAHPQEMIQISALLVREGLEKQEMIALVVTEKEQIDFLATELSLWNVELNLGEPLPILWLFLHLFTAMQADWALSALVSLGQNPLIRQAYRQKYAQDIPEDMLYQEEAQLWQQKNLRQARTILRYCVRHLSKKICGYYSSAQWLSMHVQALSNLLPLGLWQDTSWLERLERETDSIPLLSALEYVAWLKKLISFSAIPWQLHPQIFCCQIQHLPFLAPQRCIILMDDKIRPMEKTYWVDGCAYYTLALHTQVQPSVYHQWLAQRMKTTNVLEQHTLKPTPALRRCSISDIQKWLIDPQRFYHEKILKIMPRKVSFHQLWGIALHTLLHQFIQNSPWQSSKSEMLEQLRLLAIEFLPPMDWVRRSQLEGLLESIASCEWNKRQKERYYSRTEIWGQWTMDIDGQESVLIARADRIDYLEDGSAHIIDYKTGTLPTFVALERQQSVQLPLEALMLKKGAFGTPTPVSQISWWSLSLTKGCQIKTYKGSLESLIKQYALALPLWMRTFAEGQYL